MKLNFLVAFCVLVSTSVAAVGRSFTIEDDHFMQDGQPMQLMASCIHYQRVRPELWEDRLKRIRAMGSNSIQLYVPWNFHNEVEGKYNWEGDRDLVTFIKLAQKYDLLVLLRPGPYICGEWEFGGFPTWLLDPHKNVTIRTFEPNYIREVEKWWAELFKQMKPLLYTEGGPIVMVQVENEYGSYGDVSKNPADKKYMEHLVSLARAGLGDDIILYTTDGGAKGFLDRGTLKGDAVYSVGDFGPGINAEKVFKIQKTYNAPGKSPGMCSEFYTGWLTHWGASNANTSSAAVAKDLEKILSIGGSVSLYMAHGGTNFGFWSGANGDTGTGFTPDLTSYDYDSPISEGGEHGYGPDGDKYVAIQRVLLKHSNQTRLEEPPAPIKTSYGKINFTAGAPLFDNLDVLGTAHHGLHTPPVMEKFKQWFGFILYNRDLPASASKGNAHTLGAKKVRDRAQFFIDGEARGVMYRTKADDLRGVKGGKKLDILVENMGRINYARSMTEEYKGIQEGVTWDGQPLEGNWTAYNLPMEFEQVSALHYGPIKDFGRVPVFYRGVLQVKGKPTDTYIATAGWRKGVVWVNGFNLGRYWETQGPQHTLYLPAPLLKEGQNDIVVLELEKGPQQQNGMLYLHTVDTPDWHTGGSSPCDPANKALDDSDVVMFTCKSSYDANQKWSYDSASGRVSLNSNPSLCLSVGPGSDPSTGQPSITVRACGGQNIDPKSQKFSHKGPTGTLVSAVDGRCVDVVDGSTKDRAGLEVYDCNGGDNQSFKFGGDARLTDKKDGHCATVCVTAE